MVPQAPSTQLPWSTSVESRGLSRHSGEPFIEQRLLAEAPSLDGVPGRGSGWLEGPPRRPGDLVRRLSGGGQETVAFGVLLESGVEWLPPVNGVAPGNDVMALMRLYSGWVPEGERVLGLGLDWDSAWQSCREPGLLLMLASLEGVEERLVVLAACDLAEELLPLLPSGERRPAVALQALRRWALGRESAERVVSSVQACDEVFRGWSVASAARNIERLSKTLCGFRRSDYRSALFLSSGAAAALTEGRFQREERWQGVQATKTRLAHLVRGRLSLPVFCSAVARRR